MRTNDWETLSLIELIIKAYYDDRLNVHETIAAISQGLKDCGVVSNVSDL